MTPVYIARGESGHELDYRVPSQSNMHIHKILLHNTAMLTKTKHGENMWSENINKN